MRREQRFRLREVLSAVSSLPRVASCGRHQVDAELMPAIRVRQSDDGDRVAHITGVQLCGSIHACPVCSPKIRQQRATDIDAAASAWLAEHGAGTVMLLTLTLPHDYGEELRGVLATVRASFGALVSGKAWQADKAGFGVRHYVVSHDATHGRSGWHPHLHVLLFAAGRLDDDAVTALETRLHRRWSGSVVRRGHRAPSREHGVTLERARSRLDVARYVAQVVAGDDDDARSKPVALEMARGDLKTSRRTGHRTPWEILGQLGERRAQDGEWTPADDKADDRDAALWREWEQATRGVQAIRWSRGLRAAVGLTVEEATDEELAAAEVGGVDVFHFADSDAWRAVARTVGGRALVLRSAERGGVLAVKLAVETIAEGWRARRLKVARWRDDPASGQMLSEIAE